MGTCSFRLISPPMKYPPQAVIGGSSPPAADAAQFADQAACRCCPINVGRCSRAASEAGRTVCKAHRGKQPDFRKMSSLIFAEIRLFSSARELSFLLSSCRRNQARFLLMPHRRDGSREELPGAELEAAEASNDSCQSPVYLVFIGHRRRGRKGKGCPGTPGMVQ